MTTRNTIATAALGLALTGACKGRIAGPGGQGGANGAGGSDGTFTPAPLRLRMLTAPQYRNAIRDLLGPDAAAAVRPPPDTPLGGFDAVGAAELALSPAAVRLYEESAHLAAQAALADPTRRAALVGCTPAGPIDEACLAAFTKTFGRRAWRRPLSDAEVAAWVGLGREGASAYGDFHRGAGIVIEALLQAPDFLYQVEIGAPVPGAPGRLALGGYEMATRLAFFLTATTPSGALLDAAATDTLGSDTGIRREAGALLARPEAREAVALFFDELVRLRDVSQMAKDTTTFPMFTPALAAAMREETQRLVAEIVWERNSDVRDVLDAGYTFANAELAALYGLTGAPASGFGRVELPAASRRGGLLGHAAFLSLTSGPSETSPAGRGKLVREKLLCGVVPPALPGVVTEIPPADPKNPQSKRQRLVRHREDPVCRGCHQMMDDIGFGLENFDALGRYRETENGLAIDATSTLDDRGSFTGARELGALLRQDPRVMECLGRNLFRAATGHAVTPGEEPSLRRVDAAFAAAGFRLQALALEIAASEAFRTGSAQP